MEKKTLEQILVKEKERRHEGGDYGIAACKDAIKQEKEYKKCSLYTILEDYVKRANEDVFFNRAMILACWELINEQ